MSDTNVIVAAERMEKRERTDMIAAVAGEPSSLIAAIARAAADPRTDIEKMQRLFEMRERLLAREAEMQFAEAIARFKEECPIVSKDMHNNQYGSKYTSIGNLVNTINPVLGKYGLSAEWELDQSGSIKVTCVLSHVGGHKKRVSLSAGPDTSGAKNPIQQIKSTITYLELITFQAATGIATHGANEDDDGRKGGDMQPRIDQKQRADLEALIQEVGADKARLCAYLKIASLDDILAANFDAVCKTVAAKRKKQ